MFIYKIENHICYDTTIISRLFIKIMSSVERDTSDKNTKIDDLDGIKPFSFKLDPEDHNQSGASNNTKLYSFTLDPEANGPSSVSNSTRTMSADEIRFVNSPEFRDRARKHLIMRALNGQDLISYGYGEKRKTPAEFLHGLEGEDREFALVSCMLFGFTWPSLTDKKPILYLNRNCHSCSILGHQNMLELYNHYKVVVEDGNEDTLPSLEDNGEKYTGIELNKKLFENIGIKDVSIENLEKMCTNDHRNCTH